MLTSSSARKSVISSLAAAVRFTPAAIISRHPKYSPASASETSLQVRKIKTSVEASDDQRMNIVNPSGQIGLTLGLRFVVDAEVRTIAAKATPIATSAVMAHKLRSPRMVEPMKSTHAAATKIASGTTN